MMDMFDLTNFGSRKKAGRKGIFAGLPNIVKAILRLVLFTIVLIIGIRCKAIAAIILWVILIALQIFMLVKDIKKKHSEKEQEATISEKEFMEQIEKEFSDNSVKENNEKLQNRFNNPVYNEEDATEFEEYDLSEANNENPVIYSDSEGF